VYDNAEDTNSKLHLFWLGVGTDDFLYGNSRDYTEFLDKKGIRCVKEYTTDKFGHTWMNAKYFLDKTLRLLFNPAASEAAMKAATPTKEKTGKEQQFTPGVMARLFPKPIISPEFVNDDVVFRFKAPDAKSVKLVTDINKSPAKMVKDSDGVWSVTMKAMAARNFKYYFDVDGMKVADPSNMYLSAGKGEKQSMCYGAKNAYDIQTLGDIPYGKVSYDVESNSATYSSAVTADNSGKDARRVTVFLVAGPDDTVESWFKDGCANLVADKFASQDKKLKIRLVSVKTDAIIKGDVVLNAKDYKSWEARTAALEKTISKSAK